MSSDEVSCSLERFMSEHKVNDKGALSVVLSLSWRWKSESLPLDFADLLTPKGGQVKGLGGPTVKRILAEHGIIRTLSSEGGRTSRGSLELALKYAEIVNSLYNDGLLQETHPLAPVENWWIDRIREYFDREGFTIQVDAKLTISAIVTDVLEQAKERQRQTSGSTIVGTVLEHLVGAKLALALGDERILHKPVSTADESSGAAGDFEIEESVVHVTTSPSEALLRKCEANLANGYRPIIVCPTNLRNAAMVHAGTLDLEERVEVFEAQEFISMNINERAGFSSSKLLESTMELVDKYNDIIDTTECNPSLRIERKSR